jgi:dynamin 1-like protein
LQARYKCQIVDVPIHLTIYRLGQFDLTLYDLPGIYYGEKKVEDMIQKMWHRYISKPNALILYTIPCTVDLNTGHALSLAREVDPKGERTLTVATKIDLRVKSSFVEQFAKL